MDVESRLSVERDLPPEGHDRLHPHLGLQSNLLHYQLQLGFTGD